jgi:hypothetical protein
MAMQGPLLGHKSKIETRLYMGQKLKEDPILTKNLAEQLMLETNSESLNLRKLAMQLQPRPALPPRGGKQQLEPDEKVEVLSGILEKVIDEEQEEELLALGDEVTQLREKVAKLETENAELRARLAKYEN